TGMRGGERCLEVLCELFPDAPLFTLVHVPGSVSPVIERRRIITSFIQRLPPATAEYRSEASLGLKRYYLPAFPLAIQRLDLRGYARSPEVIYPPVDVSRFEIADATDDYYLVVSALIPYKRIDLAVEAATRLDRRLVVVGTGPEESRLRALAGPSVTFLGYRS